MKITMARKRLGALLEKAKKLQGGLSLRSGREQMSEKPGRPAQASKKQAR
jgi:hypothetical protein